MPTDIPVPDAFTHQLRSRPADETQGVDGSTWLEHLPGLARECLTRWDLTPDGSPDHGYTSLVLPVRRGTERLALKITWPHADARHEHLALQAWRGIGAVRLIAADPARWALLLERCEPATGLEAMSALDAAETIGALHVRLRHPALPQVDTASAWCARIAERLTTTPPALPRRLVQQGTALAIDLGDPATSDRWLVHSDLHYANVMATNRANTVDGYVAIDPKPVNGELALTVAPVLWNRWDEAASAYHLRNHLRYRVDYACDPMGVDPARARAWSILRLIDNAWHATADARARAASTPPDLGRTIAIIKAMQG